MTIGHWPLRWPALAIAALVAGGAGIRLPAEGAAVEAWLTTGDQTRLLARDAAPAFVERVPLARVIDVDASRRYQTMVGFGAAITDASAWLIRNRLSEVQRQALLQEVFGRGDGAAGFALVRPATCCAMSTPTRPKACRSSR